MLLINSCTPTKQTIFLELLRLTNSSSNEMKLGLDGCNRNTLERILTLTVLYFPHIDVFSAHLRIFRATSSVLNLSSNSLFSATLGLDPQLSAANQRTNKAGARGATDNSRVLRKGAKNMSKNHM